MSIVLSDDPVSTQTQFQTFRSRIGSPSMCFKIESFVYADRETKENIRKYAGALPCLSCPTCAHLTGVAATNNLELVECILRGGDEPRLDAYDLKRINKAARAYKAFMATKPTPLAKSRVEDPDTRLMVDLQKYLMLVSIDRDRSMMRDMLADPSVANALEHLVEPLVDFIKRVYKCANGARAISDLQKFLNQLIVIVEALRTRVQEPQKSIRTLARLLARHEQSLYTFLHLIHKHDSLIEEFLQWGWCVSCLAHSQGRH